MKIWHGHCPQPVALYPGFLYINFGIGKETVLKYPGRKTKKGHYPWRTSNHCCQMTNAPPFIDLHIKKASEDIMV